jgi:hypothetical protein
VGRALAHELGARIGKFLPRTELNLVHPGLVNLNLSNPGLFDLRLCRTSQNQGCENGTDTENHDSLAGNFLRTFQFSGASTGRDNNGLLG